QAPIDLAAHFRWHGDAFTDGQVIDTITPKNARRSENDPALRAEPVWDPEHHPGSWRAVWAYSAKRAARDNKTLTAQENRAKAVIAGQKAARTPRFVRTSGGKPTLDEASLARARRLVGLKGYVSNISAELMPAGEVIWLFRFRSAWWGGPERGVSGPWVKMGVPQPSLSHPRPYLWNLPAAALLAALLLMSSAARSNWGCRSPARRSGPVMSRSSRPGRSGCLGSARGVAPRGACATTSSGS